MNNCNDLLLSANIKYAIYDCIIQFSKLHSYFLNIKNTNNKKKYKFNKLSTIWEHPNM